MNPPDPAAALVTDPLSLFVLLTVMVGLVFYLSEIGPFRRFFDVVPPLVFCYFLPMLTTTFGITPAVSPLYDWFSKVFLPPILILLLLSADLRAIVRLGPKALAVMLAGAVGITGGAVLGYALMRGHLEPTAWKSVGALAASWTGGSANMGAVAGALDIPKEQLAPIIILDPVFAYSWMGILIALSAWQCRFDERTGVDPRIRVDLEQCLLAHGGEKAQPVTTRALLVMAAVALGGGWLCSTAGTALREELAPVIAGSSVLKTFSATTLTVIFATLLGLVLSATPLRKLEASGASKLGYTLLFLLLSTFGAQADLGEFDRIPAYAAVAFCMIAVHALMIWGAMRLLRAPLFLGATASQANLGGPASAAVVATAYEPPLAPVGVLLGILGGAFGTLAGLICANLCSLLAP